MTREDVDLTRKLICVQAKTIGQQNWQPEIKRKRVVPISDALHAILLECIPDANSLWSFPSPRGKRWDCDNLSQDLRRINKAYELDWTCLDSRHMFGSHLAQKGISLYEIAALMGNSPEICRRHYAVLIPEEMRDVVEFNTSEKPASGDDAAKKMLQEILAELKGSKNAVNQPAPLKLIRVNEPA